MIYKRLGEYIHLVDNRNSDLKFDNLLGINITKNFMPSVANVTNTDLSKYKIIKKGQFAYSGMQTGRDETIRIVLYTEDTPAIISPAYSVIEVNDEKELLPKFMMMWFQRPESDRYGWFISDSSVRANLDYERLCEIEIPIPDDIEEQRKYVNLYQGLLDNQKCYEKSLDDLQLICDTYIEDLKSTNKDSIGNFIEPVDLRNTNGEIDLLLGVNINKEFMPSKAKVTDIGKLKYKVVSKNQFVTNVMHVDRDEILPIALYEKETKIIVSPAYKVFKIKEGYSILPEFFMLWLRRKEFDRLAWFFCDSSVRGGLDWERFCEIKVPVPDIKIQEAIVTIYHTLETRKRINEQLKDSIKPLCPVLMRGVMERLETKFKEVSYEI